MSRLRFSIAVMAAVAAGPLMAAASGGMGGGSTMPSQSGPSYDPTEEYRKGLAAMDAKDYRTAKSAFDRVIAVAPKDAMTQYYAGMARAGLDDWKGARKFFDKAVKLDPNQVAAWKQLGIAQAKSGEADKAAETLAGIKARAATCGACANAAALKDAETAVAAAMAGTPAASTAPLLFSPQAGDARYLEAVALINEKRFDAAIESLQAARASFGPHPDILTYLGFANRKLKRFDVAEDYYRQALAVAPTHRGATEYFGELMVERGDLSGARTMLAKLDAQCRFGCAEAEELRAWIAAGRSPHSS